jgi:hypothetical protein
MRLSQNFSFWESYLKFIHGEGLIPCRTCGSSSAAIIKVLNPSPIPYENNIPRGSAARLLIGKSELQTAFSRAFFKTNRVLGNAIHLSLFQS